MQLAPQHDVDLYSRIFAQYGRLHIPDLLREEDAQRLHQALAGCDLWHLTVIHGGLFYDLTPLQIAEMTADDRGKLEAEVYAFAARQYEGRYSTIRLSETGEPYEGDMTAFADLTRFLNSAAYLDFARRVIGSDPVDFADVQATCYDPGDFLHPHFDVLAEKKRVAAYVLNLTPGWRPEWGGLLCYVGPDGHVTEAYTPAWNALNLLQVDQLHFVSCVAPFAPASRYSVTGWLRAS